MKFRSLKIPRSGGRSIHARTGWDYDAGARAFAMKIISGGQTGVDRAALDVALKYGIECGGSCPAGRLDEFGKIPSQYPVSELHDGNSADRTLRNVADSEGTVVIYRQELGGGTKFTVECCRELKRPHLLIDAAETSATAAAALISEFVHECTIKILNVAGPRQSEWPEGYDYAWRALSGFVHAAT